MLIPLSRTSGSSRFATRSAARSFNRCVTPAMSALATAAMLYGASIGAAHADAYADRVNAVRNTYYNGGWIFNYPTGAATAAPGQEWKKGIFYSAMAAFAAGDVPTGVLRANQGLQRWNQGDMFYLVSLVHLYKRYPEHFSATVPLPAGKIDKVLLHKAIYTKCWETVQPGAPSNLTPNHLLMYNAVRVLAAEDPYLKNLPADNPQTGCAVPGLHTSAGVQWLRGFMDGAVRDGFMESDSPTYVPYYLSVLRLLADKHQTTDQSRADLATMAGMTHDWITANLAGEWLNGEYAGTSARQYFAWDGTSYSPIEIGTYLWTLFGGKALPSHKMYATVTGVAPPSFPTYRKPTGGIAVPLAVDIEATRPAPWLVAMGTERGAPYGQREIQAEGTKVAFGSRHVEPGVLQLATQSQPWQPALAVSAQGWGSSHAQDMTFHWYNTSNPNRSLTITAPLANSYSLTDSLGAQPQLQWFQQGRAAVGALFNGAPGLIRGVVPTAAATLNGGGWRVFDLDNAFVGVRSATPWQDGSNGVNGERDFRASGANNLVVVDSAPKSEYNNDAAFFLQQLQARPFSCIGVSGGGCTSPTSAPAVTYTSLKGDQLSIAWPSNGGAPVRTLNGTVQDPAQWPVIENPWVYQAQGKQWIRMSGAGTTRIYHFGEPVTPATINQATNWKTFIATAAPNGGFEAGTATTPSQWVQGTWSGAPVYARVASPVHSGASAGSVTLASSGNGGFSLNATARPAAVPGQQVTVTAWLRTSNVSNVGAADGGAYVYAQYVDDAGALMCAAAVSTPLTGTHAMWQSRSATLPAPCAGATRVAMSVRLKGTGTVWADDVDFTVHD